MIRVDIGEIIVKQEIKGVFSNKKKSFKLIPSFENISKIGDPERIIDIYTTLISNKHIELCKVFNKSITTHVVDAVKQHIKNQEQLADLVIGCCSDNGIPNLKSDKKVNLAVSLLKYGVSSNAKVRVSQRNTSKKYQSMFDINQYISNARVHLGLSLEEAKQLTMTEYVLLMANKYPDNDGLTSEEYDNITKDYERRRAERLSQAT